MQILHFIYAFLLKYLCQFVLSLTYEGSGNSFNCKDLAGGKNTAYCLCAYRKPGLFGFYLCLTKSFECDVYLCNANLLSKSRWMADRTIVLAWLFTRVITDLECRSCVWLTLYGMVMLRINTILQSVQTHHCCNHYCCRATSYNILVFALPQALDCLTWTNTKYFKTPVDTPVEAQAFQRLWTAGSLTLGGESSADPASPPSASPRRALQLLAPGGRLQLPAHRWEAHSSWTCKSVPEPN